MKYTQLNQIFRANVTPKKKRKKEKEKEKK